MAVVRMTPRVAVSALFACLGIAFGSWAARLPEIKTQIHASNGLLGLTLAAVTVGSFLTMLVVGSAITRYGSRAMAMIGAGLSIAILPLLALPHSAAALAALLFCYGVSIAWMDVSMNTQAVLVESEAPRPLMSGFHGWFSVGGLAGAALSVLAIHAGLSPAQHFTLITAGLALVALVSAPRLMHGDAAEGDDTKLRLQRVPRALLPLALIIFCGLVGEGAAGTWSGVYLRDRVHVTSAWVPAAFAAFSLTMAIGRFLGDGARVRFGTVRLVLVSGLIAGSGMLLAVAWPSRGAVIVGFALVGLGLAPVYPSVMSVAGSSGVAPPGEAVALIAMVGWMSFLVSPPLVGGVADAISLRFAFFLIAVAVTLVAPLALTLRLGRVRA